MSPYRTQPPEIWPGILEGIPDEFASCLKEPAFSVSDVTFCIWRQYSDDSWSRGPIEFPNLTDADGSVELLKILDGDPERYQQFAEDYYESPISIDVIRQIYNHVFLTGEMVTSLNSEADFDDLSKDLAEIGYPCKSKG